MHKKEKKEPSEKNIITENMKNKFKRIEEEKEEEF